MKYDVAYQEWLEARRNKNYGLADSIREEFERNHALTIYAEGEMPIIDKTVRRMKTSDWHKKYDNRPGLVQALLDNESRFGDMYKQL